jgi:hypothetical protein
MKEQKPIDFKVLKKNKYGHRFILEPKERIKFREKCKYNKLGCMCEKGYDCLIENGVLIGCTPDVCCPRMMAWDKRHGLEKPYTMVENEFPDLKSTTFTWHPATQSPGKRRIVIAFKVKGHENDCMTFETGRFLNPDVTPATCAFKDKNGTKKLAVAWAYYDEISKGIADWMIESAKDAAWAWWDEETKNIEK